MTMNMASILTHVYTIAVICFSSVISQSWWTTTILPTRGPGPFDVRLVDSPSGSKGRLEVHIQNEWLSVCATGSFGRFEANLVCSQLGHDAAMEVTSSYSYWQPSCEFDCTGSEKELWQCRFIKYDSWCHPVVIRCADKFDVRLVDGPSQSEGRLEVFLRNEWGKVCRNAFDNVKADLVCRQLGFDIASEVKSSKSYGQGSGPIVMTSLSCDGSETYLWECRHGDQGENCGDSGVVAIKCSSVNDDELFIRLSTGPEHNFGNIEVFYNGTLGYFCHSGYWGKWGMNEANVACKQLGFKRATHSRLPERYGNGHRVYPSSYMKNGIVCEGTEERLDECNINDYEIDHCHSGLTTSVICTKEALLPPGKVAGITMASLLAITMVIVVLVIIFENRRRKHISPGQYTNLTTNNN